MDFGKAFETFTGYLCAAILYIALVVWWIVVPLAIGVWMVAKYY